MSDIAAGHVIDVNNEKIWRFGKTKHGNFGWIIDYTTYINSF